MHRTRIFLMDKKCSGEHLCLVFSRFISLGARNRGRTDGAGPPKLGMVMMHYCVREFVG